MDKFFQNEEKYTRVATFLYNQAPKFGLSVDEMSRMKITPSEVYIKNKVTAGGVAHLLTGNSTQETGVTNFDGNRLEAGRYFVLDGVKVLYGEADDTAKVYEVAYKDASQVEIPAVLQASELVVRQNGEIIVKLPMSSIFEAEKRSDDNYRVLGALAVLQPLKTVEISIETPIGSTITPITPGKKSFVSVLFRGFETFGKR